jgi:hypothetical protein
MNRACQAFHWHARCILGHACRDARLFCIDVAMATAKLTEDPPFGGLWCDQPALFLPVTFAAALTPGTLAIPTTGTALLAVSCSHRPLFKKDRDRRQTFLHTFASCLAMSTTIPYAKCVIGAEVSSPAVNRCQLTVGMAVALIAERFDIAVGEGSG